MVTISQMALYVLEKDPTFIEKMGSQLSNCTKRKWELGICPQKIYDNRDMIIAQAEQGILGEGSYWSYPDRRIVLSNIRTHYTKLATGEDIAVEEAEKFVAEDILYKLQVIKEKGIEDVAIGAKDGKEKLSSIAFMLPPILVVSGVILVLILLFRRRKK